jgi:DNA-binding transcriptional LysR family regulator
MEELMKQRFVLTEPSCQYRKRIDAFFQTYGGEPNILMESSSTEAILKIVESGLGITYLHGLIARGNKRIKQVRLKEAEKGESLSLQLLVHKNKWKSKILNEFIRICEENNK